MCREQIEILIKENKKLYGELHKIHLERNSLDSEFLLNTYDEQPKLQKLIDYNEELEQEKYKQIKRSRFFGIKYTKSDKPIYCMPCFIYKNTKSTLKKSDSSMGNGIKTYSCIKCTTCFHVDTIAV